MRHHAALEFTILTAARSAEVRLARWSEVDLDEGLWIVPAERTKMRRARPKSEFIDA